MMIGFARASAHDQNPDLQLDAAQRDRPELTSTLEHMRAGDLLVVWKLDRLARSLSQLTGTVGRLEEAEIGFRSISEAIDTTEPGGRQALHIFGSVDRFEREIVREQRSDRDRIPPDLAIEVERSHRYEGKSEFYRDMGTPEMWRLDIDRDGRLQAEILDLQAEPEPELLEVSKVLPRWTTEFIVEAVQLAYRGRLEELVELLSETRRTASPDAEATPEP